jgi:hypothetical protein
MPARNPWLADGVYPTSHFNSEATDSVLHAGPVKGNRLTRDKDVKVVSNVMVSNPALKKVGTDTAATAPGAVVVLDRDLNVKSYIPFSGRRGLSFQASQNLQEQDRCPERDRNGDHFRAFGRNVQALDQLMPAIPARKNLRQSRGCCRRWRGWCETRQANCVSRPCRRPVERGKSRR